MKKGITIAAVILLLVYIAIRSFLLYYNQLQETKRVYAAVQSEQQRVEYYKTINNREAARNNVLELKINELAAIYPAIIAEIKNLKIKPGRVETFTNTIIKQEKPVTTILKDSIRLIDSVRFHTLHYQDQYYNISGLIVKDSLSLKISSQDTISQVVYKGKRIKPWLWVFSRRQLQQSITCQNPANKILYSKTIKILK